MMKGISRGFQNDDQPGGLIDSLFGDRQVIVNFIVRPCFKPYKLLIHYCLSVQNVKEVLEVVVQLSDLLNQQETRLL